MSAKISLRLAKEQDFKDVLEVSEGIYDGRDYLPVSFHRCLKSPNMYVFVAELQGKVIGLLNAVLIDGGQTLFAQSLRIHREYRGRGYSYQIMIGVIDRVCEGHPQVSKVRYMAFKHYPHMKHFSERMSYRIVMERHYSILEVPECNFAVLRGFNDESKQLHEMGGKDAAEFVLNQRKFDALIPKKILVVLERSFELMPANAGFVFEDDDKIFTDVSIEELRQDVMPRSFSHGRMLEYVNAQTSWMCNIYANDRHAFKAQLVRQIMAAIEQLEKVERKIDVEVLYSTDLDFDVREVFEEVLGLKQTATIDYVLYEKTF